MMGAAGAFRYGPRVSARYFKTKREGEGLWEHTLAADSSERMEQKAAWLDRIWSFAHEAQERTLICSPRTFAFVHIQR